MKRLVFVFALVFMLFQSATAVADTRRVLKAQSIAVEKWGNVCDGQVKVFRFEFTDGRIADAGNCTVRFKKNMVWFWEAFCTVMIHEYGHLFGYRPPEKYLNPEDPYHSTSPNSVMYPYLTAWHPSCIRGSTKGVRKTWR